MEGIKEHLPQSLTSFAQTLLDLEKAIVIVLDTEHGVIAVNASFFRYLPFDSLESFRKKHDDITELFVETEKDTKTSKSQQWLDQLLNVTDQEHRVKMLNRQGTHSYFTVEAKELSSEDKRFFIVQFDDFTKIEKAHQAQLYFEEFKKKFLTSLSHEFRTPMNGIIGFADLLDHTEMDETQKEYLGHITQSAYTMIYNIDNLLELSQLESNQVQLHEQNRDLIIDLERFLMRFCTMARDKEIQLLFYIDPRIPKVLRVDFLKVKKILMNLIHNAIKFTSSGGQVYVEVSCKQLKSSETLIEYAVNDTGVGIEKEQLGMLLRPFASAKENQSRGKDGLGVGLSVCYRLSEMMDAKLKVATKPGKGSRFSFTLQHTIVEKVGYELVNGSKMAVWADEKHTAVHAKLLKKYLEAFNVDVVEVNGLADEEIANCSALFITTNHLSHRQMDTIKMKYPAIDVIPVSNPLYEDRSEVVTLATLMTPILPNDLYKILGILWKKTPLKPAIKPVEDVLKTKDNNHGEQRVLIAEDNPINLRLIETLMKQYQLPTQSVTNGKEAVELFKKDKGFSMVFMDIDMPVMDGITATKNIKDIETKERRKRIPIIALTAHGLAGDRERILKEGLDNYIPKPLNREKLELVLKQYLNIELN